MNKEQKLNMLNATKAQIEAEIASDNVAVDAYLQDPAILESKEHKDVVYNLHEIYHHLAVHKCAKDLIDIKILELEKSK